jgi:hypothetical protein
LTPVPQEILDLRALAKKSYRYRTDKKIFTEAEYAAMTVEQRKGIRWAADQKIVDRLCAAEAAHTRRLFAERGAA